MVWCLNMEKTSWDGLIEALIKRNMLRSPTVIKAIRSLSRDNFLPENLKSHSDVDTPLPIGFGQTISAPHSLCFNAGLGETWFQ